MKITKNSEEKFYLGKGLMLLTVGFVRNQSEIFVR